jgi:hypothetical protein
MNKIFESAYIYAILIFLGFYNYYCFYNHFDINIATFLTSGELLLSFLPLTLPIVIIGVILMIFYIRTIVEMSFDSKKQKDTSVRKKIPDLYILSTSYTNLKSSLSKTNRKSGNSILLIILNILGIFIGIGLILYFIWYIFYFLLCIEGKYVNPSVGQLVFYGLLWFILFDELIEKVYKNNSRAINISRVLLLLVFSVGFINFSSSKEAKEIINGKSRKNIVFEYNNSMVKTDMNLVYVGKTEKYLFLRNLKEKENYIYPTDKIGMIKTSSTE